MFIKHDANEKNLINFNFILINIMQELINSFRLNEPD